jgi:hypothetical protein
MFNKIFFTVLIFMFFSTGLKAENGVFPIEYGIYKIPLYLPESLESRRNEFDENLVNAQGRVLEFAKKHNWEDFCRESFADKAMIFDNRAMMAKELMNVLGLSSLENIPDTLSGALESRVLMFITPEIYSSIYPDGIEEESYEKLIAHEIIHRLHVRILNGNEEAMGPIWFFEGFAIYGSGQFADSVLERDEIWEIVEDTSGKRISYRKYGAVIRYFLKKASLRELVENAGRNDFIEYLKKIDDNQ